jgi:hypothetical protein
MIVMFEHLSQDFFSKDLILAHLESGVGRGELAGRLNEMMKELRYKNPALAASIKAALGTAPSVDTKIGFLSGAFYILDLLERKLSSENLGRIVKD